MGHGDASSPSADEGSVFRQVYRGPHHRPRRGRGFHGGQLILDGVQLGLVLVGLGSHVRVLLEQVHVLLLEVGKKGGRHAKQLGRESIMSMKP